MRIRRTVESERPVAEVFEYMSDFTTTEEWDPGTVRTTRVEGDGGVGTLYDNTSKFLGRETRLKYEVMAVEPGAHIHYRGENETVIADDHISLRPRENGGSLLTYDAQFKFKGIARLVAPLMAPAFKRLGDQAKERLTTVLG